MNTKQINILGFILSIVLVLILGFVFIKGSLILFEKIDKINPNVVVAIIAGTVTILGYFITRYLEKKKLIEQQIREQKLPTLEEFIDFIFNIFKKGAAGNDIQDDDELKEFFWQMNKKSILWLSDNTLKSYINWKTLISEFDDTKNKSKEENLILLIALEDLLMDFRKDIGHKNKISKYSTHYTQNNIRLLA